MLVDQEKLVPALKQDVGGKGLSDQAASRAEGDPVVGAGSLLGAKGGFAGGFGAGGVWGSFCVSSSTTMSQPGFLGAGGAAGALGMDGMETTGEGT